MKDRITEFLVKENISPAEFADKIGVQRSSVSHVLNGRNYPGASFLQKILASYKSLNPRWLLLGEGLMLESKYSVAEPSLFPSTESEVSVTDTSLKNAFIKKNDEEKSDISEKLESKIETNLPGNTIIDPNHEIRQLLNELSDNKEIDKIVLFYKDKTFALYTPSK